MVRTAWGRAVLALTAGLGVWSGLARAQECGEEPGASVRPGKSRPFLNWLFDKPPCGCFATHNSVTCGNLRSEYVFIFGSCRDFYNEPCLQGPPNHPFPVDPSYQTAPGYPGKKGYETRPE